VCVRVRVCVCVCVDIDDVAFSFIELTCATRMWSAMGMELVVCNYFSVIDR